jgi:small GTP-binding protein
MDCYFFKTVCVGDAGVGKTHLMETIRQCLCSKGKNIDRLSPIHETIGVQFYSKMFVIDNNKRVKIHFWDLSGQKRFREIIELYYIYGDAILLCFDMSNYHSFLSCYEWIKELKNTLKDESYRPYIFLLGIRKRKYKRAVNKSMIKEFVKQHRTTYLEFNNTISSAYKICDTVIRMLIQNIKYIANHRNRFVMSIDDDEFTDSPDTKFLVPNDSFSNLRLSMSSSSRSIRTIEEETLKRESESNCCFTYLC